jgi:hypothetical protein
MKKFVYVFYGYEEPTPEVMKAWGEWFAVVGKKFVDSGTPFGPGRVVTKSGASDVSKDESPITAYSIVSAENMEEAEKLLEGCPIIDSVRIYESMSM